MNQELLKKVEEKYKNAFEKLIDEEFHLYEVDKKLESANLLFAPSNITLKYKNTKINSNYMRCLNYFYVEELDESDIEVIKKEEELSNEILDIVKRTYQKVITKKGVKTICYNPPTPERIIENGSLVLELSYGKNTKKVPDEEYINLIKKQKEIIGNIIKEIEKDVLEKWNIPCKILVEKRV